MKRIFAIAMVVILFFLSIPILRMQVSAEIYSGECGIDGDNLTWTLDTSSGVLTIIGDGAMAEFEDGAPWNSYNSLIYEIALPEGLTSISSGAFHSCSSLTEATIPDSVEEIGYSAFAFCTGLETLSIGAGISNIASNAFGGCTNINTLSINACSVDAWFNDSSKKISTLSLGPNVQEIKYNAFSNCNLLMEVIFPSGLTTLGANAFKGCTGLSSVDLPDSVLEIGDGAFSGCTGLYEVKIGTGVSSIGDLAFFGCNHLRNLIILGNVSRYGENTFTGCTNLRNLTINSNAVGNQFRNVKQTLTTLTLGNNVKQISSSAFSYFTSLSKITIPSSLTTVSQDAFIGCNALNELHIADLTAWCNLQFDYYTANPLHYAHNIYLNNSLLTDLIFPETNYLGVNSYSFSNATCLKSILIPGYIQYIGSNAFENCSNVNDLTIEEGVTSVSYEAFKNCSSLSEIIIPESVQTIYHDAFKGCTGLERVYVYNPSCTIEYGKDTLGNGINTVIYCFKNSTAHNYAIRYAYSFAFLDEPDYSNPFTDVSENKYYFTPVLWAYYHNPQITSGKDETHFAPNDTCTRAEVMTFLYHAMNDPEINDFENPFSDVKEGKYYYKPVLWAYHHDPQITGGATETTFGVKNPCKREQVVTFLWKAAGAPEPETTENPFSDVSPEKYYYKAILWAVENGVTSGMGDNKFGVGETCTRGQIVTFLYKAVEFMQE